MGFDAQNIFQMFFNQGGGPFGGMGGGGGPFGGMGGGKMRSFVYEFTIMHCTIFTPCVTPNGLYCNHHRLYTLSTKNSWAD